MNKIHALQDATYELLGLLDLAGKNNLPADKVESLIISKIDTIYTLAHQQTDEAPFSQEESEHIERLVEIAQEGPDIPESVVEHIEHLVATAQEGPDIPESVAEHIEEEINKIHEAPFVEESSYLEQKLERAEKNDMKRAEKPVFTLNDRFLFTRELFKGNKKAFDDSLTEVAGMDNYEEAEEYFLSTLGWDEENKNVKDFLKVIAKIFD